MGRAGNRILTWDFPPPKLNGGTETWIPTVISVPRKRRQPCAKREGRLAFLGFQGVVKVYNKGPPSTISGLVGRL